MISSLAKEFPDVQYYGTHRIVEYHGWLCAKNGKIVRRYAYLGDQGVILCDEGERTEEEKKLGFAFDESKFPSENDVMKIAGAWSINPATLDEQDFGKGVGYLGAFPK